MLFSSESSARAGLAETWGWPNFQIRELSCRCDGRYCAGEYWHARDFLGRLQTLRERLGRPLIVTSAHRCPLWNASVGGAPLSQHKTIAVDLDLRGHDRSVMRRHAEELGFSGFGLGRSFLHLDIRTRPAIWFYPGSKHLWEN